MSKKMSDFDKISKLDKGELIHRVEGFTGVYNDSWNDFRLEELRKIYALFIINSGKIIL